MRVLFDVRQYLRGAALAGFAYFAVVFAAGVALGALRVLVLIPWLGKTGAVLVELPVILGISWVASRRIVSALDIVSGLGARLVMGGVAFLSLMLAELGLSVLAFGQSFAEFLAQYREVHALLGLAGQAAFGLFPAVQLLSGRTSISGR